MKLWFLKTWKENKPFILFLALMFTFRSAIADWNTVPTGSMKPTIIEGDRILVNKVAYDLRIPFTRISLFKVSDPLRGDIVIFESGVSEKRLVKRVIGLPGDVVELRDNVVYINERALNYDRISSNHSIIEASENLLGSLHRIWIGRHQSLSSSFNSVRVPADHYLVLGDNRDNSADSRVIGFVPRNEIIGRTKRVVVSFNYDNYYIPRADRVLHDI